MEKLNAITIASSDGSTKATFVPERGGAISSITMPGKQGPRELLYLHDFFWDAKINDLPGGWPFCFPVCARLERQGKLGAYLYDGKIYVMKIHGFAWYETWITEAVGKDYIVLMLRDNEHTRKIYPFSFSVKLKYQLSRAELICEQTYQNLGNHPMPYYAGFHPYFLTPAVGSGKEKVRLDYHPQRRLVYNDDLTDITGETTLFRLPTSITDKNINEQLTMVGNDKTIHLHYPDGDTIHMVAEGIEDANLFSYIQLYTMAEKPFICIEPWMSFPNAMNSVAGVRWLLPQQSEHGLLKLWLE